MAFSDGQQALTKRFGTARIHPGARGKSKNPAPAGFFYGRLPRCGKSFSYRP